MGWRPRLQKLFSTFPYGWPGFGLLLLRLTVGVSGFAHGFCRAESNTSSWTLAALDLVIGAVVVAGFLTPFAGAVAAGRSLYIGLPLLAAQDSAPHCNSMAPIYLAVISIALILLGPGAFSVDARLFGRREIIIPEPRRRS